MMPHDIGIQVDILKYPAVYTLPSLGQGLVLVAACYVDVGLHTHSPPVTQPAINASIVPMSA
jgi:hypothetical protein